MQVFPTAPSPTVTHLMNLAVLIVVMALVLFLLLPLPGAGADGIYIYIYAFVSGFNKVVRTERKSDERWGFLLLSV